MTSLSLNVGNFITLKLTPTNYPLWREQALALVESQDLVGHLTNEDPAPTQYTTPDSNNITNSETFTPKLTNEFVTWRKADRLLRGWIIGTLSEEALGLVVGLDTSHAVWDALKDAYAEDSQEREFTLRQQITYLRKEDDRTIGEHIRVFKGLCDNLAAIGKPIPDKEKVFYLLTSLGPDYETFTTTMLKPPRPSYSELISQLQSLDQRRSWFSSHTTMRKPLTPHMAFYGQHQQRSHQSSSRHRGISQSFTSTGRGFQAQTPSNQTQTHSTMITQQPRPPPPGERRMTSTERELYRNEKCQYCGKMGHIAKICWWVPKKPTQPDDIPQALAALTLDNTIAETEWTSDTGASNHMTGKPSMLNNIKKYSGTDSVLIGDGSSLPILGTGDSFIKQRNVTLPLHNVLLVPSLTKNLLSISQLTKQFPVNCEFSNVDFCVKERETGKPMITGRRKGDLYVLSPSPELHYSHRFKSGSADTWHQRLGHPQTTALQLLKNKGLIDVVGKVKSEHLYLSASSSTSPCFSPLSIPFHSPIVHLPVTTSLPSTRPLTSSPDQLGTTHESITQPEQSPQPEVGHLEYSAQPSQPEHVLEFGSSTSPSHIEPVSSTQTPPPQVLPLHPMVTRSQRGIATLMHFCPKLCLQPRPRLREGINNIKQDTIYGIKLTDKEQTGSTIIKETDCYKSEQISHY
ncbi:Zinc finger, CCHC-type [Sesbania bispinosa]|nr:Zinc finger, CCHC-type [Sesbania bispinosa]